MSLDLRDAPMEADWEVLRRFKIEEDVLRTLPLEIQSAMIRHLQTVDQSITESQQSATLLGAENEKNEAKVEKLEDKLEHLKCQSQFFSGKGSADLKQFQETMKRHSSSVTQRKRDLLDLRRKREQVELKMRRNRMELERLQKISKTVK
ncbi:hypothetical protein ADEAN_000236100 [Angomonas deanei]|uniref:Uncharacterized protein n=1 Tax=Angomonas deanei TaxID=59799 RepID=A0A7G2C518_9TRYP|nr:hypothetical protein ADEAN_000236100 [Angomonas deanei]